MISLFKQYGLHVNVAKELEKCVNQSHYYFRSFLKYELSWESHCFEHCLKFGLSDPSPKEKAFQSECSIEHSENCFHCSNINFIIDAYEGVLDVCKPKMDEVDTCLYQKCLYKIRTSYDNINKYNAHLLQSACQSMKWDQVMEYDGSVAIAICDFR